MDTWPGGPSGRQFSPWGDRGPLGPGPGPIWNPKFKKWTLWGEKSPCGNTHRQTKLFNFKNKNSFNIGLTWVKNQFKIG